MRISVFESKELQATLLAIRGFEPELKKQVRSATKKSAQPIWQESVNGHVSTRLEARALGQTARVSVSDQNISLQSARIGKPMSGGLDPKTQWAAIEFGGDRQKKRSYTATSSRGKNYKVSRRTAAQLRGRRRGGYVVFPAAKDSIPRIASLWVQTTIRTFHEALEGKS